MKNNYRRRSGVGPDGEYLYNQWLCMECNTWYCEETHAKFCCEVSYIILPNT